MENIHVDKIILDSVKIINAESFAIYCYIQQSEEEKIRLKELMEYFNFSKPTVIKCINILKKFKLIKVNIKIEEGRKCLYLKCDYTGKNFLPVFINKYNNNYININNNSISINDKKKTSKKFLLDVNKTKKLKKIYYKIIERILSHPRYNNDYYRDKKYKFGEREQNHLKRLLKTLKGNIKDYINWWLEKKASKTPGFNIGFFSCVPFLEEYLIYKNKTLKYDDKKTNERKTKKINDIKLEMVNMILNKVNSREVLNIADKEFFNQITKENIIEKINDKWEVKK